MSAYGEQLAKALLAAPVKKLPQRLAHALLKYGKEVVTGKEAETGLQRLANMADAVEHGNPQATIGLALNSAPLGVIKAFHGSPYAFDAFDASKIGSGEGSQMYGHGLYFASHPDVAMWYAKPNVDVSDPAKLAALYQADNGPKAASQLAYEAGDWEPDARKSAAQAIRLLRSGSPLPEPPSGRFYDVELEPDEDEFLDWDQPLNAQSPKVQSKLSFLGDGLQDLTGKSLYHVLGEPAAASQVLRDSGIPGIKYRDALSRAGESPTYNYVLFDPSQAKILSAH